MIYIFITDCLFPRYLKYLYLTLLKKKVVSEWKRETEQARSKQSEDALHAEIGIPIGDKLSADSAEEGEQAEAGNQASRHASEEERQAAKEKLARWKAEKQRQAETEKVKYDAHCDFKLMIVVINFLYLLIHSKRS